MVRFYNGRERRDVIGWKQSGLSVELASPPIGVELVDDIDHTALLKTQFVGILPLVLV